MILQYYMDYGYLIHLYYLLSGNTDRIISYSMEWIA